MLDSYFLFFSLQVYFSLPQLPVLHHNLADLVSIKVSLLSKEQLISQSWDLSWKSCQLADPLLETSMTCWSRQGNWTRRYPKDKTFWEALALTTLTLALITLKTWDFPKVEILSRMSRVFLTSKLTLVSNSSLLGDQLNKLKYTNPDFENCNFAKV